jgi:hypothetical protein
VRPSPSTIFNGILDDLDNAALLRVSHGENQPLDLRIGAQ